MTYDEYRNEMELIIDEMSDEEAISLYNAVAQSIGYETIQLMDEFDTYFESYPPSEVIRDLDYDFDIDDYYFSVDDANNIKSFTDLLSANSPFDRDTIIDDVYNYRNSYGVAEIQDLIDRGIE